MINAVEWLGRGVERLTHSAAPSRAFESGVRKRRSGSILSVRLSSRRSQAPAACPERSRRIRPDSRRIDFKFSLMIYVGVIGPNGSEQTTLVNRVIVMNFGENLVEDNPEEMMAKPEVREAYLGTEAGQC